MSNSAGDNNKYRPAGEILEIFSGIQGEGPLVGVRQVFVRFAGCNLDCFYCDTMDAFSGQTECLVEQVPGHRDFESLPWPLPVDRTAAIIRRLLRGGVDHHSISLTGGEPLVQSEYVRELLCILNGESHVYLETNGTLPGDLESVLDLVDIISVDVKVFPRLGGVPYFDRHRLFLELAAGKRVFVKFVLMDDVTDKQIETVCRLIARVDRSIPLVLQPVTKRDCCAPPASDRVLEIDSLCLRFLPDVRVIPQVHKVLGQR